MTDIDYPVIVTEQYYGKLLRLHTPDRYAVGATEVILEVLEAEYEAEVDAPGWASGWGVPVAVPVEVFAPGIELEVSSDGGMTDITRTGGSSSLFERICDRVIQLTGAKSS